MSSPARTLFSLTLPLAQWVQKPLKTEVKRVVKKTTRLNEHVSMPSRAPAFSLLSSRNQPYFRVFHARCLTCVTPSAQEASPREIAVREAPRRPCPRDRRRRPPGTASRRPLGRKTHTTPPLIKQERHALTPHGGGGGGRRRDQVRSLPRSADDCPTRRGRRCPSVSLGGSRGTDAH